MKKIILLITIVCAGTFTQNAFTQNPDSLYAIWQDPTESDSVRVGAYRNYIWNGYMYSNPDSASVLAEALQAYTKKHKYPNASAQGYYLQGHANYLLGNYSRALEYNKKSMAIYEEIGDKKSIANCLNTFGFIYFAQGNNPRALEYYKKALVNSEAVEDQKGKANVMMNIGIIYREQGNFIRALEYNNKALVIFEEHGNKNGIANGLINNGNIYSDQGDNHRALEYYEKSLVTMKEIGNKWGIAAAQGNIGIIYGDQGDNHLALEYLEKTLVIFEEFGDKSAIAGAMSIIGSVQQKQGKAMVALEYCQKGLALAEEIGDLENQKSACKCLYESYKDLGKGNKALVYLEKMRIVEDSLNAEETGQKLQQMEFAKQVLQDSIAQAEADRLVLEAHQEEVRQKNKTRNGLLGGGAFVLLLAGGLFARNRYITRSKATLQIEKDRSENLLLNILPEEIAQELKIFGKAEARDFDLVSILFTDFKEFTQTSEKLTAQELVGEINTCFEAFDAIMAKHKIEKIKTIGDAYMAAGGLPVPTDDSIKNTVLAALEMQEFITSRKMENELQSKPAFEMRVGIHTGPVVAGIVGVKKFQYDIWGDTVNTASRIESNGDVGKVNISQNTYELLKDDSEFTFESRGKIEAKGKGEVEMYFVSKA